MTMKDFAYFLLPLGAVLALLLAFAPCRRIQRLSLKFCCLHLQLGPVRLGAAAFIVSYSALRLLVTVHKLHGIYKLQLNAESSAAVAVGAAAGFSPTVRGSSYQLRHERNLWIEAFCLVLWVFVWRMGKVMAANWELLERLESDVNAKDEQIRRLRALVEAKEMASTKAAAEAARTAAVPSSQ